MEVIFSFHMIAVSTLIVSMHLGKTKYYWIRQVYHFDTSTKYTVK